LEIARWLQELHLRGFDFKTYAEEVTDFDSYAKAAAQVTADIGPIDVMVNNAGITRNTAFLNV
jgi:acetoacetyl-CoA reductase